jgi:hypothetical protein
MYLTATCSRDSLLEELIGLDRTDKHCGNGHKQSYPAVDNDDQGSNRDSIDDDNGQVVFDGSDSGNAQDFDSQHQEHKYRNGEDGRTGRDGVKTDTDWLGAEQNNQDIRSTVSCDVLRAIQRALDRVVVIKVSNVKGDDDVWGGKTSDSKQQSPEKVSIQVSAVDNVDVFGQRCPAFDKLYEKG